MPGKLQRQDVGEDKNIFVELTPLEDTVLAGHHVVVWRKNIPLLLTDWTLSQRGGKE